MPSQPEYHFVGQGGLKPSKPTWHPMLHLLMLGWLAYVAAMLFLLHYTTWSAKTRTSLPWYLDWLPGILLTGFAQAHLPITATYLSHLGLSALHNEHTKPRSWAELLWLAGGRWQGPIGLITLRMDNRTLNRSLSSTFVLFAFACTFAIATPTIISRAWPASTVYVAQRSTHATDAFSPPMMTTIEFSSQIGTGEGAWATGLPADQLYSGSAFKPTTPPVEGWGDFLFAGSIVGEEASLPGVRVQGGCQPMSAGAGAPPAGYADFEQWCNSEMATVLSMGGLNFQGRGNTAEWWWCMDYSGNNTNWMNTAPVSSVTALVWFNTTDGTNSADGFIQCNATYATGNATLSASKVTYDEFTEVPFYNTSEEVPAIGSTLLHPLYAALWDISQEFHNAANESAERGITLMKALGYTSAYNAEQQLIEYSSPSLATVATQLWQGTAHMGAAIALLARAPNQTYDSTLYLPVSGRVEKLPFIVAGGGLLAAWLVVLLVCTLRMGGRAFGSSLDIYVAARQFAEEPMLLYGQSYGDMAQNMNLRHPFTLHSE